MDFFSWPRFSVVCQRCGSSLSVLTAESVTNGRVCGYSTSHPVEAWPHVRHFLPKMAMEEENELSEIISSYSEPSESEEQESISEHSEEDISETSEDRAFVVLGWRSITLLEPIL